MVPGGTATIPSDPPTLEPRPGERSNRRERRNRMRRILIAAIAAGALYQAGVAIAPLVYVPLFHVDTRLPFVLAAGFSALLAVLILPWFRRYR